MNLPLKNIDIGQHHTTYRGVFCQKLPFDYVLMQMLICEVKPDLIIEIGTRFGGSALYYADILNTIGKGVIHTIDVEAPPLPASHPRIKYFTCDWREYRLPDFARYPVRMIIEDSSHTYENTLAVMEYFGPGITPGSYMVVEDGNIPELGIAFDSTEAMLEQYHGGPLRAIREFLPSHPEFEIDRKWCDFYGENVTANTDGYLRKIK